MLAIFTTGGKQHRAEKGLELKVEKLNNQVGDEVTFDKVLMVSDGADPVVGQPYVAGASVKAEILEQGAPHRILDERGGDGREGRAIGHGSACQPCRPGARVFARLAPQIRHAMAVPFGLRRIGIWEVGPEMPAPALGPVEGGGGDEAGRQQHVPKPASIGMAVFKLVEYV